MRFAPFVLAAACLLTLFVGLDTVGYLDQREARDARVAEELRSRHEWLTPVLAGEPLFDRPLLGYLPELLTHDSVEESPLASRLLRAALATLVVLLTWSLGTRWFGESAGISAGLVIASALALPLAARTDGTQLIATLMGWLAIAGFARTVFAEAPSRVAPILSHAALAVACLVAGPLSALWPLGGVALYARLSNRSAAWTAVRPLPGLLLVAGVALPWYGAMIERHGMAFVLHAWRFPYGVGPSGPWFAGVVLTFSFLVAGAFPWSALLPAAFAHAAMRWRILTRAGRAPLADRDRETLAREERDERVSHFLIACLMAALVPIAFYPSPPLSAALPALPAVALLCGRFLAHLTEDPERLRGAFARSTLMLGLIGTVIAIASTTAASRVAALFPGLRWIAPFALLSGWAPFLTHFFLRRTRAAAALIAVPIALGTPLVAERLLPGLEDYLSARALAISMNTASPPLAPLVLIGEPPPTLRLYLERNLIARDSLPQSWAGLGAEDGSTYLGYGAEREREMARRIGEPLEILARTSTMALARVRIRPGVAAAGGDSAIAAR